MRQLPTGGCFLIVAISLALTGCGDTPDLELSDDLRQRLTEAQSALARYEAEHREGSTETIAKMKNVVDVMLVAVSNVAKRDGA